MKRGLAKYYFLLISNIGRNKYLNSSNNTIRPLTLSSFLIFISSFSHYVYCQWEPLNGPYGGVINELKNNNEYVFAATPDGLFRSTDGEHWEAKRFIPGKHLACLQIGILDSLIIADAVDGSVVPYQRHMYRSADNGDTWLEISRPPSPWYLEIDINSYGIYGRGFDSLWVSSDEGMSWKLSRFPQDSTIGYMTSNSKNILVSCRRNIYKSAPNADKWSLVARLPPGADIDFFYQEDSLLMALDDYKHTLYRSKDGGEHWTTQIADYWYGYTPTMVKLGNEYFINLGESIFRSSDAGMTWQTCASSYYPIEFGFANIDSILILGSLYQGVFKSIDRGHTFISSSHGITAINVDCLTYAEETIYAACTYTGVFDLDLNSGQWNSNYMPSFFRRPFNDICSYQGHLFLISDPHYLYKFNQSNWVEESDMYFPNCTDFFFYQDKLFAGGNKSFYGGDLKFRNPSGPSWSYYRFNLGGQEIHPLSLASNDEYLFVSDYYHVYRKHHFLNDWIKLDFDTLMGGNPYQNIMNLYSFNGKVFIVQENDIDRQYRILMSNDNGNTWSFIDEGFPPSSDGITYINSMYSTNSFILVTTYGEEQGIVASGTDEIRWFDFNQGLPTRYINDLTFDEEYIYAAASHHGVWRRKISDLFLTALPTTDIQNELFIYPNPASESIYISLPEYQFLPGEMVIMNLSGQNIVHQRIVQPSFNLNVSDFPPGLYVVQFTSGNFSGSKKVLIQN